MCAADLHVLRERMLIRPVATESVSAALAS